MSVREWMTERMDAYIADLARLVRYNSVEGEAKPGMPFGEEPAAVLAEALAIAEAMGFKTVNLDNYCGYAEAGSGDEIIGIAGHLDIVPVGDGWNTDPLTVVRDGDRIYGRGVIDDKGPTLTALYALKSLVDAGVPLNKRVRVIMGCNEETGSACMKHYAEVEEPISMGFTPDANFPCIHGEKGIFAMTAQSKNTKILAAEGGFVINAVCHQCTITIPAGEVSAAAIEAALAETPLVAYMVEGQDGKITINAQGVAAHASLPHLGVNAASFTMKALQQAGFKDDFVDFYVSRIGTSCDGAGCGLKISDQYGELTFNNGIIRMEDGVITCTIDIRFPVTYTAAQLRELVAPYLEDEKGRLTIVRTGEPLFFPEDSPLVQAVLDSYRDVTGEIDAKAIVIGGGTYAKSLPGIIAFGPEKDDKDYHIHNANEFALIPEIIDTAEIYAKAIENMLKI